MLNNLNIFYKKKILIYGLGKSGLSVLKFLKKNNEITTHDDKKKIDNKKLPQSTKFQKNHFGFQNFQIFNIKKLFHVSKYNKNNK